MIILCSSVRALERRRAGSSSASVDCVRLRAVPPTTWLLRKPFDSGWELRWRLEAARRRVCSKALWGVSSREELSWVSYLTRGAFG
jgi:hypothetical protein